MPYLRCIITFAGMARVLDVHDKLLQLKLLDVHYDIYACHGFALVYIHTAHRMCHITLHENGHDKTACKKTYMPNYELLHMLHVSVNMQTNASI